MAGTEGQKREAEGGFKTPPAPHKLLGTAEEKRATQETPIMFSRASSVTSLDSFDHDGSLQDGYSSYEASHATSGRVSPSDLPDSPSQTMPTSPPPGASCVSSRPGKNPRVLPLAPAQQKSVYADVVRNYREEGTPMIFSTSISLSGLDFDEEKMKADADSAKSSNTTMSEGSESLLGHLIASAMPQSNPVKAKADSKADLNTSDDSSCSMDHQDLLAECIASAMPVGRTRLRPGQAADGKLEAEQDRKDWSRLSLPSRVLSTPPERMGFHLEYKKEDGKGEGVLQSELSSTYVSSPGYFQSHLPRSSADGRSGSSGSSTGSSEPADRATGGETNGPKINRSTNSSLSELSIEKLDNSDVQEEEEDLLAACISSAMPKSKHPALNHP